MTLTLTRFKIVNWIFFSGFILLSLGFTRDIFAAKLTLTDPLPRVRWINPKKEKPPGREPYKSMWLARKSELDSDFEACSRRLSALKVNEKKMWPWIQLARLRCAFQIKGPKRVAAMKAALNTIEKNKEWMMWGAYSKKLRAQYIEARLSVMEEMSKKDRNEAVATLEELLQRMEWMDSAQRARLLRWAGENAFIQQKLRRAEAFIRNSLNEKENPDLREKLNSIRMMLLKEKESVESRPVETGNPDLMFSEKEREISQRMSNALKSGDLVAATEDGLELIKNFPGSQRANWAADRIYEVLETISSKDAEKYASLKTRIVGLMEDADGIRLFNWVEKAYKSSLHEDVKRLAEAALKKLDGTPLTTDLLNRLAHSNLYSGDEKEAKKHFQTLLEKHGGTPAAIMAQFRLGLIEFRAKEYASAVAHFERLLVLPDTANFEVGARYWLWRSLQKTPDQKRANQEAAELIKRFPLTYYGLRAQAETNQGVLTLPDAGIKNRYDLDLSGVEKESWELALSFMQAGWHEEAQQELSELMEPSDALAKALLSRYWTAAMGYPRAIRLMNQAWTQEPSLQVLSLIKVVYPTEYREFIEAESKKYSLDPLLIASLIRQESAFDSRAVSSSGAMGLMQLLPSTGQESYTEIKLKPSFTREALFNPAQNIAVGTYYLQKMIKKFDGNIAWALAAYNAGPERFGRWARIRGVANTKNSAPEDETWMDELPWNETNFYVKAILRNLLIYRCLERTLDRGRVVLPNPIWAYESVEKK